MATWNKITTSEDYQIALQRVDELIDVDHTEATHNELMLLSLLIEGYEDVHYPIQGASPLRVLKFMMEMKGIKQQDLIPILGSKGNVSKILSGKAKLQLEDVHPLSTFLGIPVDALIPTTDNANEEIGIIAEYADARKVPEKELNTLSSMVAEEASSWKKPLKKMLQKEKSKK